MSGTIALPIWLAVVLVALAALASINHFFLPALRWLVRRYVNSAIKDVNTRFSLELPTFQLTKRQVLIDRLTYDPVVMAAVAKTADERGVTRDGVMAEVVIFAREMVPAFNAYFYFRLGYRLARRFLRAFYRVRLGWAHEAALAEFPPNAAVVFFINHRSNMDYLLVTYLASRKAAVSYGAGEWARIWPFRSILRLAGAYILRRNTKDPIYRVVLQRYVQMATAAAVPHAIFSEGQLSRNGMVNAPKLGMLGYICRNFDVDGEFDILLIPVATNFDRVVEERTLIANAETDFRGRGARFVIGSTGFFVLRQIWRKLTGRWKGFGMACANFGEPVSLRSWSRQRNLNLKSLEHEPYFAAIEALGSELSEQVVSVVPILPVPLLAMALLEADPPLGVDGLIEKAHRELEHLCARGGHAGMKPGTEAQSLKDGVELMREVGLITFDAQQMVAPKTGEEGLLQYHANSIIQLKSSLLQE